MIIRVTYVRDNDPNKICVFRGDMRDTMLINTALTDAGILRHVPGRYNILVHPITGLECALAYGDVVEFDTDTFKFTAIQGNKNVARWERIEFEAYTRPLPATKQYERRIDLADGLRGVILIPTVMAALESYVVIRINSTGDSEGEVMCTADIPFINSDIDRMNAEALFTYRGHIFKVCRDGTAFTITHSGHTDDRPWAEIIFQIYTK